MKSLNINIQTGYIALGLLIIVVFVDIPGSELIEKLLNNPENEKHFLPDKWLIPNLLLIFVLFKSYQLAVKNSRIITGFYQNGYLFSRLRLSANKKMNRLIMSNLISNNILCISIVYICSALILKGFESLCLLLA
jgi:hypothetical protein